MTGDGALLLWVLRNVAVSAFLVSPATIALIALANGTSRSPGVSLTHRVAEATGMLWVLALSRVVALAAAMSGLAVVLSLVLTGKRHRTAVAAPLVLLSLLGMSGSPFENARW